MNSYQYIHPRAAVLHIETLDQIHSAAILQSTQCASSFSFGKPEDHGRYATHPNGPAAFKPS
jgi:hypothetical protein